MISTFRSVSGIALLILAFITGGLGAKNKIAKKNNQPLFISANYKGEDSIYANNPLAKDEMYNPILQGFYPDPSITRKGNDYYLVCSSFAIFPGVPIFHSTDLVNWKQIGHVLDRTTQLKLDDSSISGGIYAPQIRYNPSNDTFYMITTELSGNMGNLVVKTKNPTKGWSDPYLLHFNGIDPSLFFDDDGKAYVVHNDAPEKGKKLYDGHRVIKIWEYDTTKDQVIPGTDKIIVDGGVDISLKPVWIEAPHLYKKYGKYYLMCAEGGTGDSHSEVIFVSNDPKGPYLPAPNNPILSQRYLDKDRSKKVEWAGHADLVETPKGEYYGVFLAVRPNEKNRVNMGRETFMLPVDWSGIFPVFENGLIPLQPKIKTPANVEWKVGQNEYFPNGNFEFNTIFDTSPLDFKWISLRGPRENFIQQTERGLLFRPFTTRITDTKPVSALLIRQQHNSFIFKTEMSYLPKDEKDFAGITCLQSEKFNYVFGITHIANEYRLFLQQTENGTTKLIASTTVDLKGSLSLKVKAKGDNYEFSYSVNGNNYINLGGIVSGDILSTNVAGGFSGCLIGLYASSGNDNAKTDNQLIKK